MSLNLVRAIYFLRPTSQFSLDNGDYSTIKWDFLEGEAPTQAEIDAAIIQIKEKEEADKIAKAAQKAALLARLGITEEEAQLLIGGSN
jgi:hypothetical protein